MILADCDSDTVDDLHVETAEVVALLRGSECSIALLVDDEDLVGAIVVVDDGAMLDVVGPAAILHGAGADGRFGGEILDDTIPVPPNGGATILRGDAGQPVDTGAGGANLREGIAAFDDEIKGQGGHCPISPSLQCPVNPDRACACTARGAR